MADIADLRKLNLDTFHAEAKKQVDGKPWDQFFEGVLAPDFRIRRSDPTFALQNKKQMIGFVREKEPVERSVFDVKVLEDGDFGVVTSMVTLKGRADQFHNVKVFVRNSSSQWECVYWQVLKLAAKEATPA